MDLTSVTPYLPYALLAGSLLVAVLLDFLVVRLGCEVLRPPSMYAFLLGRLGKLAALVAWLYYFNSSWYPRYAGAGQPPAGMVMSAEWAVMGVFCLLAFATLPRPPRPRRETDG